MDKSERDNVVEIFKGASQKQPFFNPELKTLPDNVLELGDTTTTTSSSSSSRVIDNRKLIDARSNYLDNRSNDSLLACLDAAVDFLLQIYLEDDDWKNRLLRWACGNGINDYVNILVTNSIQLFCYNQDTEPYMPSTEEIERLISLDSYKEQLGILIMEWSRVSEGVIPMPDQDN